MINTIAASSFVFLTAAVVVFQVALMVGAPWGEFTLGGRYPGRLPRYLRLVPAVSGVLLIGFAIVVLARSGLAFPEYAAASRAWVWVVVAYCAVGALANYVTPSHRERAAWLPVVLVMLVTSAIVAMT